MNESAQTPPSWATLVKDLRQRLNTAPDRATKKRILEEFYVAFDNLSPEEKAEFFSQPMPQVSLPEPLATHLAETDVLIARHIERYPHLADLLKPYR